MNLNFSSVRDAAIELRNTSFPRFSVLSYNRWDVDHSQHWWLSPTRTKAAFRHGKIIFTTADWVEEGKVFCAFNVEKGQRKSLGGSQWTMTKDWFWHRFVDLTNTELSSAIAVARIGLGENLRLVAACGIPATGAKWDYLSFNVDGDRLERTAYRSDEGVLIDIAEVTTIPNFATAIRAHDSDKTAWYWTDILIGQAFTLNPCGDDNLEKCAAMLRPFESWMR